MENIKKALEELRKVKEFYKINRVRTLYLHCTSHVQLVIVIDFFWFRFWYYCNIKITFGIVRLLHYFVKQFRTLIFSHQAPYRPAVEVTSMSYLPNTQIESYLGNLNLFLIRESHTVREVKTKLLSSLFMFHFQFQSATLV